MKEFFHKLKQAYSNLKPPDADVFGRRPATRHEVIIYINPTFENQVDQYQPTADDIAQKDQSGRRG